MINNAAVIRAVSRGRFLDMIVFYGRATPRDSTSKNLGSSCSVGRSGVRSGAGQLGEQAGGGPVGREEGLDRDLVQRDVPRRAEDGRRKSSDSSPYSAINRIGGTRSLSRSVGEGSDGTGKAVSSSYRSARAGAAVRSSCRRTRRSTCDAIARDCGPSVPGRRDAGSRGRRSAAARPGDREGSPRNARIAWLASSSSQRTLIASAGFGSWPASTARTASLAWPRSSNARSACGGAEPAARWNALRSRKGTSSSSQSRSIMVRLGVDRPVSM